MEPRPAVGTPAPPFEATDQAGRKVGLQDFRGRKLVLFFYVRDEARPCRFLCEGFASILPQVERLGGKIVGVSVDTADSHAAFARKHELNYPLLADVEGHISEKYGALEPAGFGKRVTYLIDGGGVIRWVSAPKKIEEHSKYVLAALRSK